MANIMDALNPLRNKGSIAHPNMSLMGNDEGVLVINRVRTLRGYLEAKRRQVARSSRRLTVSPRLSLSIHLRPAPQTRQGID